MNKINDITVDILMATYNGEKYVSQQIESILVQSHKNFNLIISDDCSMDGTREILDKYAEKDNRIKIINNNKNLGVISNFEHLISNSNAEYFLLSDQDDVWSPRKVEKSLQTIINSDAMLVYSDLEVVNSELELICSSYWKRNKIKPIRGGEWKKLIVQNIVTGCTIIASAELKHLALPFPKEIEMHDSWLALVASFSGVIEFIDEPLLKYRQHETNYIGAINNINSRKQYQISSYSEFLKSRKEFLVQKSLFVSMCIEKNDMEKIKKRLFELERLFNTAANISYFSFSPHIIKGKIRFHSQGFNRNIWWICYYQFPLLSYIIINFLRMKKE